MASAHSRLFYRLIPYWFVIRADNLNHRLHLKWNWPCWLLDWYFGALPSQNRPPKETHG